MDKKLALLNESNKKFERRQDYDVNQPNIRVINKDPSIYPNEQNSLIIKDRNKYKNSNIHIQSPNLILEKVEENARNKQNEIRKRNIESALKNLENTNNQGNSGKIQNFGKQDNFDYRERDKEYMNITENNSKNNSRYDYDRNHLNNDADKYILPDPSDIDDMIDNIYDRSKQNNLKNNYNINSNNIKYNNNINRNSNNNSNYNNYNNVNNQSKPNNNEFNITYSNVGKKDVIADDIDFADEKINNFERIYNFD